MSPAASGKRRRRLGPDRARRPGRRIRAEGSTAEVRDPKSGDVRFASTGTVNAITRVAALSTLQATWKGQNLHLLAPARVGFGNGMVLDHLRLGLGQGMIEANGRVSPTLDLTVAMRNLSA